MSLSVWVGGVHVGRFPRVSGDEPWIKDLTRIVDKFSPRERG